MALVLLKSKVGLRFNFSSITSLLNGDVPLKKGSIYPGSFGLIKSASGYFRSLFLAVALFIGMGSVQAQKYVISAISSVSPTQYHCQNAILGAGNSISATFTVISCGGGGATPATVNVQWFVNNTNSTTGGAAVGPLTAATSVGTAASVSFSLSGSSIATGTVATRYYYCVVSGSTQACGSTTGNATSTTVRVDVVSAPVTSGWSASPTNVCSGQSYTFTANPIEPSASVSYSWSNATNAAATTISATGNTAIVSFASGLTSGSSYTIRITATGCGGSTTLNAPSATVRTPVITNPATTTYTVCQGTAFGATLTATATFTAGIGTYQWYSNTTASNTGGTSLGAANGAQTATYTPQSTTAGTLYYYCVATSPAAEGSCPVTSTVSGAWTVNAAPVITTQPTTTSQTVCTGLAFTTNPSVDIGLGSYQWYSNTTASNTGGTLITGATSASYTPPVNVNGTTYYYVVVTGANTCTTRSNVSGAFIVSAASAASITIQPSTAAATACQNGSFTNALTVAGSGIKSYQWFSKATNANYNSATTVTGATSASFTPPTATVGSLYYFCTVTGCGNATVNSGFSGLHTVNANPTTPTFTTNTSNTKCSGASNGALTASSSAGATFLWYSGSTVSGSSIGNTASISALSAGQYTVQATLSGCSSVATVTVTNSLAYPSLQTSTGAQTNCTTPNGSVSANVGASFATGSTAGHTFDWYSGGTATGSPLTGITLTGTSSTKSSLSAGQYTVVATSTTTGCATTTTVTVGSPTYPSVQTQVTNRTSCTVANGAVSANVGASFATGATANHSFSWYSGATATGTPISANITSTASNYTAGSLDAGQYTVKATITATGCATTSTVTVASSPNTPAAPSTSATENTQCTGTPDGAVSALVGGTTTGYTFAWYSGSTVSGSPISNTSTASSLPAGSYTVQATLNSSGCTSAAVTQNVINSFTYPSTPSVTTSSNTNCTGTPNGSAAATVGGITAGYNFSWYNGATVAGSPISNAASASALAAGTYTVQASFTGTGCSTSAQANVGSGLDFTISTSSSSSTNCTGAGNGSVSANVSNTTSGYTFAWFSGGTATGTALPATSSGTAYTASSLAGGQSYTVSVTSLSSGCTTTSTVNLADDKVNPVLILTPVANTRCDAGSNGTVTGSVTSDTNFQSGDTYTYSWSSGTNMGSVLAGQTTSSITGRPAGSYTATVTNNRLGCTSAAVTAVIVNSPATGPSSAVLSSPTSFPVCPNGAISVKVDVTGGSSPYSFTLSNGSVVPNGYVSGSAASVAPAAEGPLALAWVTDALGCTTNTLSGSVLVSWKTLTAWMAGSGAWDVDGNWSCGVPTSTLDASIPTGVVVTLPAGTSDVRAITIAGGGSLTFSAGSVLRARGDLVNAGTIGYSGSNYVGAVATNPTLLLNGSSVQVISGSGTFNIHNLTISNTAGVVNEAARIDLFNTLSLGANTSFDADGANGTSILRLRSSNAFLAGNIAAIPTTASLIGKITYQRHLGQVLTSKWRYVSTPLTGFTLSGELSEWITKSVAYYYSEPVTGAFSNGWIKMPSTYSFGTSQIGRGYQSWNTPSLTEARGDVNQGTIRFPISYTATGNFDADGWNCIGNPYPSNIVWNNSSVDWNRTNIGQVVYIPDNKSNVWRTVDWDGLGNIPSGLIAAGQGFWVYANGANPLLEIRESAKRADTTKFYRQASPRPALKLSLKYDGVEDNAYLLETPGTTTFFDRRQDAIKLEGDMMGVSLLTADGRKLVYSHVPEMADVTPLSIWGSAPGRYTFSVSQMASDVELPEMYFVDRLTGLSYRLEQGKEIEIDLRASEQTSQNRFYLSKVIPNRAEEGFHLMVFPNPAKDKLTIQLPARDPVSITIMAISGVIQETTTLTPTDGIAVGDFDLTDLKGGVYVVEAKVNGITNVSKFIKF